MTDTNKPVAIVLGGIVPHGELLRQLKNRGYYTILVDYFDNPPAAEFADEHSHESAMDYEAVLKIAKERQAKLVMSSCLDQQMVIAMRVSEQLDLPHPFSSETALKVTNKKYMKKIMMENGIPTAMYYQVDSETDLDLLVLDFPVMVKPTDCCGSAGTCKIESKNELKPAVENACKWSRTGEAIVEEFKQGMEVSVYCYVQNEKAIIVEVATRISKIEQDTVRCYCAVAPANITEKAYENMKIIANRIAGIFRLKNTPMFYQALVKGDEVCVLEFSPRLGGGLCHRTMPLNAKVDMISASIDSYLGQETKVKPHVETIYYLIHFIYGNDGIFDHLEGYQNLLTDKTIDEIFFLKTKGMEISNEKASSSRTAVMLLHGKTAEDCLNKLNKAWKSLEIRDSKGNSLMDKSLCLTKKILEENMNAASQI